MHFRDNFGDWSTNYRFPHRLNVSHIMILHRMMSSTDLLDVLYETKVYHWKSGPIRKHRLWGVRQRPSRAPQYPQPHRLDPHSDPIWTASLLVCPCTCQGLPKTGASQGRELWSSSCYSSSWLWMTLGHCLFPGPSHEMVGQDWYGHGYWVDPWLPSPDA